MGSPASLWARVMTRRQVPTMLPTMLPSMLRAMLPSILLSIFPTLAPRSSRSRRLGSLARIAGNWSETVALMQPQKIGIRVRFGHNQRQKYGDRHEITHSICCNLVHRRALGVGPCCRHGGPGGTGACAVPVRAGADLDVERPLRRR